MHTSLLIFSRASLSTCASFTRAVFGFPSNSVTVLTFKAHSFSRHLRASLVRRSVGTRVSGSGSTRRVTSIARNLRRSPTSMQFEMSSGSASFRRFSIGMGAMFSPPAVITSSLIRPLNSVTTYLREYLSVYFKQIEDAILVDTVIKWQ